MGKGEKRDARGVPVLRDLVLILRDLRGAGQRGPIRALLVVKGDIDVRVVLELVELVRCAVRDEHERELCLGHRCAQHAA